MRIRRLVVAVVSVVAAVALVGGAPVSAHASGNVDIVCC